MSNPNTAVLDAPSLTLPNWRTALKRRVKRPKKPDWRLMWARAWRTYSLTCFVLDMVRFGNTGRPYVLVSAIAQLIFALFWHVQIKHLKDPTNIVLRFRGNVLLGTGFAFIVMSLLML